MTAATETTACPDWHRRDALRRLRPDLTPPDHCGHPQCPPDNEETTMAEHLTIPCAMHRKDHTLTPREAAVVIVTQFALARELADDPDANIADHDECVREILNAGKDTEGYYEHVTSILGDDAIDYPDYDPQADTTTGGAL